MEVVQPHQDSRVWSGFDSLTSDQGGIPPQGARFDAYFDGEIEGPRLKGRVSCADYIHVRGDGRIQLHIHGEITTDDGEIDFFIRRWHIDAYGRYELLPQRERDAPDSLIQVFLGQRSPDMGQRQRRPGNGSGRYYWLRRLIVGSGRRVPGTVFGWTRLGYNGRGDNSSREILNGRKPR